jgi:molybdopterin-guanine dinucleotide biosynthesis protein B
VPKIISIIGRKNAGKTTLVVALARELVRGGRRVATIKHTSHPAEMDRPGTDTWRHVHEGQALGTLLVDPNLHISLERTSDTGDPVALAARYFPDAEIVLVEGMKSAPLPKIEVHRSATGEKPLYDRTAPNADQWIAVLTDDPTFTADCRVMRYTDTMWLQLLARLVWDHGKVAG